MQPLQAWFARLPNVRFLLIGRVTGVYRCVAPISHRSRPQQRFYIAGYTSLVAHKIAQAALLVAPAVEEGHGRTLIEAMMLNTPVAASRSGGHVEIVQDGINGRLFDVDDPVSMAEVIIEMLSKPDDTTAMTRHAATLQRKHLHSRKSRSDCHQYISAVSIMMTKSLAITIESMGAGGAQLVIIRLIRGLLKKGFHVHLITLKGPETDFFEIPENVVRHVLVVHTVRLTPLSHFLKSPAVF